MQELDDIALLREYAERGSDDAFATLVARHINKVYSVALRQTRNSHHAEEITQAVFVILARKSRSLGKGVILEGWLYQTARLTALAAVRSEFRRVRREQEAYMQSVSHENDSGIWLQIAPLLDTAIAGLGKTDQHAVVLRFFYGKNMKEVGMALGLSEGATRLRLHRTMEKLRGFFEKRGVISTSGVITAAISTHAVQSAPMQLTTTVTTLALAKVPAASASTLTLIKGALKIMAWTKAKTAVAVGAVVLLAAGTTPLIIKEIRAYHIAGSRPEVRKTVDAGSIKGQFFSLSELVDAGNATPEAAWESRYWARAQGDYDNVIAGTDRQAVSTAKDWMGDRGSFRVRSQSEFASFRGFQILARKNLADDTVELKYQFGFEYNQLSQQTKIVTMVKVGGAWRCARTRGYEASWDADSQPEPES